MSRHFLSAYERLLSTKRCGDVWIFYQLIFSMYRVALDWPFSWFKNICCSVAKSWLFGTPCTAAHQAPLSFSISWSLLKLMSIESVMPSNLYHPLLLLPSVFPSIRVFSNESTLRTRWPKYWSFSFSISPSDEYPRLKNIHLPRKFPGEEIY